MARTITDADAAASFARVIASDLAIYNEPVLARSLREGRPFAGLEDELAEAQQTYLDRVSAALEPMPLLLHALAEFFARWATERGLPSEGIRRALAEHLVAVSEA